jgi:hypothetical protein
MVDGNVFFICALMTSVWCGEMSIAAALHSLVPLPPPPPGGAITLFSSTILAK